MLDGTVCDHGWNTVYGGTHNSVSPVAKFCAANETDDVFTSWLHGYTNWKAVLELDRGLQKHASSQCHVQAMATWSDLKCRKASGETIDCMLVGKTQLEKKYVKSTGGVVKFLCFIEQKTH